MLACSSESQELVKVWEPWVTGQQDEEDSGAPPSPTSSHCPVTRERWENIPGTGHLGAGKNLQGVRSLNFNDAVAGQATPVAQDLAEVLAEDSG